MMLPKVKHLPITENRYLEQSDFADQLPILLGALKNARRSLNSHGTAPLQRPPPKLPGQCCGLLGISWRPSHAETVIIDFLDFKPPRPTN